MGIILSDTSDGRLIFMLPYHGYTLVGTTDQLQDVEEYPQVPKEDVDFLKKELVRILGEDYDFDTKLKASFAGLRPLCLEEPCPQNEYKEKMKKVKSKELCRSHIIEVSKSGLVSLLGGKWTSYRVMGEECVNKVIETHNLNNMKSKESNAFKLKLLGSYSKLELHENMSLSAQDVATKYKNQMTFLYDIPLDISERLIETYGLASLRIVKQGNLIP